MELLWLAVAIGAVGAVAYPFNLNSSQRVELIHKSYLIWATRLVTGKNLHHVLTTFEI
jgi:hypothetical protein